MVHPQQCLKHAVAGREVGLLAGMGQRFGRFCARFGGRCRRQPRTVETPVRHYWRELLQAETKNMERLEEVVPDPDHQALQHSSQLVVGIPLASAVPQRTRRPRAWPSGTGSAIESSAPGNRANRMSAGGTTKSGGGAAGALTSPW